jgi:RNA polymerase sigma factor (TIGR02999 family)
VHWSNGPLATHRPWTASRPPSTQRSNHTWQATALVNELFLKLIAQREPRFQNRLHFYNACARLMRLALIDHARGVKCEKRGGDQQFVPLHEDLSWFNAIGPEAIDLDESMRELAAMDSQQAELFEARYLLGCSVEETAAIFEVSKSTVDRKTRVARAWLYRRLTQVSADPADGRSASTGS